MALEFIAMLIFFGYIISLVAKMPSSSYDKRKQAVITAISSAGSGVLKEANKAWDEYVEVLKINPEGSEEEKIAKKVLTEKLEKLREDCTYQNMMETFDKVQKKVKSGEITKDNYNEYIAKMEKEEEKK